MLPYYTAVGKMPGSQKPRIILENSSTKNPKYFFFCQLLSITEQTSGTLNLDEFKSLFMFHARSSFHSKTLNSIDFMYSNAARISYFTTNVSRLLMLLSTGNMTALCENKVEASEMTKKESVRLFSFFMTVTSCVTSMFVSLMTDAPKMYFTLISLDQVLCFGPRKRLAHKIL